MSKLYETLDKFYNNTDTKKEVINKPLNEDKIETRLFSLKRLLQLLYMNLSFFKEIHITDEINKQIDDLVTMVLEESNNMD